MTDIEVQESYTDHDGGEFSAVNVRVVATWPAPTFVENLAIDPAPFAELPAPPVGLAFDADGSLWATGGTFREGPGYIWRIGPDGSVDLGEPGRWSAWLTNERLKPHHPQFPGANGIKIRDGWAWIISDNGPQFIAKDFKEFIRISGITHVRTSPYYPQSNGKIERWHKSLKGECIRPGTPLSLDDARRLVEGYVEPYNNIRLNSAVGYITPKNVLAGRQAEIHAERDRKLEETRKQSQIRRQQAA